MPTTEGVNPQKVGKLGHKEREIRLRLKRWLRYYRERKRAQFPEDKDLAAELDISPSHLSNMLAENGDRTPGLDLAVKMSETFRVELDRIAKDEPPSPVEGSPPVPSSASPSAAKPGRRRRTGGGA